MIEESFDLTIDDHATAGTATMHALQADVEMRLEQGPLGWIDRVLETAGGWGLRLLVGAVPLIVAVPLLLRPGTRFLGALALLAVPVAVGLVAIAQRLWAALDARVDRLGDRLTDRAVATSLRRSIERGEVPVLQGTVTARLDGHRLEASSPDHRVSVPDVRRAWRCHSPSHLVLAAAPPSEPSSWSRMVLLPRNGVIALAVERLEDPAVPPAPLPT